MIATELQAELLTSGLVRLSEGFASADADRMRRLVWRELDRVGVRESEPATWPSGRHSHGWTRGLQDHRAFQAFWTGAVRSALDAVVGSGAWARPRNAGDILLTFPERSQSLRQLDPLHSDFAMDLPAEPLFAVKIFAFISPVAPRSGGTLIVRNSHLVVQRYLDELPRGIPRTQAATRFARDNLWLVRLGRHAPIGSTHDWNGIEVHLEELTGEPGDVVITHPWTLHAGATSEGTTPRIMLGHRIFRTERTSNQS